MAWCEDEYEPECEGFTCPKWGRCAFSKDVMSEDTQVKEEWDEFNAHVHDVSIDLTASVRI